MSWQLEGWGGTQISRNAGEGVSGVSVAWWADCLVTENRWQVKQESAACKYSKLEIGVWKEWRHWAEHGRQQTRSRSKFTTHQKHKQQANLYAHSLWPWHKRTPWAYYCDDYCAQGAFFFFQRWTLTVTVNQLDWLAWFPLPLTSCQGCLISDFKLKPTWWLISKYFLYYGNSPGKVKSWLWKTSRATPQDISL